ncbi:MAG: 3-hydroxyacyl-ACP dehydratase FabZ family protein [Planctomycetota bacterium]
MGRKEFIVDPADVDFDNPIADIEEIRKYNPQRFEMEQLTGIVYVDADNMVCAGFKDITENEVWVRGHMPGMPLMPGIFMCEAAAQVCSYVTQKYDLLGAEMVGFGGMENVRFRGPVRPGDRLMIACRGTKCRRGRMIVCEFQGTVGETIVVEGGIKGIPLPISALTPPKS